MTPTVPIPLQARIFGIGGAGASALEYMAGTDLAELRLCAIHTDAWGLQQRAVAEKVLVGAGRAYGIGTGGDPEIGRAMAEEERPRLDALCAETNLAIILAGLGGGTGTGIAPVLAASAKKAGALTLALVTLPFEFEGPRRMRLALAGLQTLRSAADAVICLPNEKAALLLDPNATALHTFGFLNELLAGSIRGLYRMLTRPGPVNVDFAYLCSILRGRHIESVLATGAASGPDRGAEAIHRLLANPLLDGGEALAGADDALVCLASGPDMPMAEINRIMKSLAARLGQANLVFGTAVDERLGAEISLTLVAARSRKSSVPVEETADSALASGRFESSFLNPVEMSRPAPRLKAPAPASTPALAERLERVSKTRKTGPKWKQENLPLEIVSRGRFEKSDPTIYQGQDLDVPTYVRRGCPMN